MSTSCRTDAPGASSGVPKGGEMHDCPDSCSESPIVYITDLKYKQNRAVVTNSVRRKFRADLSDGWQKSSPIGPPEAALREGLQRHQAFRVPRVPAHSGAFQSGRQGLASRFRRAAA